MKVRVHWNRYAQLVMVLLSAVSLKYFYSTASVNQLRWILAPTTLLVELISGVRFQFESHAGYMSSDHTFLIAASCAGVNFLLTAFLMLSLRRWWKTRGRAMSWKFLPVALLIAYFATLAANTVRIATALRLRSVSSELTWLNPGELHRLEGILIYFGFLMLLFMITETIDQRTTSDTARPTNLPSLARNASVPLIVYYATTLGIPLAGGAYREGAAFWQHALSVLLTPLFLIIPWLLTSMLRTGFAPKPRGHIAGRRMLGARPRPQ